MAPPLAPCPPFPILTDLALENVLDLLPVARLEADDRKVLLDEQRRRSRAVSPFAATAGTRATRAATRS
jgi:hypothetical protein